VTGADWDHPPGEELDDSELDAVLARADAELLDHVRAHTNPHRALMAMMAANTPEPVEPDPVAAPSIPHVKVSAGHAVTVIAMRSRTRNIDSALRELRSEAQTVSHALASAQAVRNLLAEFEAPARRAAGIRRPSRWLALLVLAVTAVLDGTTGYVAVSAIGGTRLASWLGAAISVAVLGALETSLAARPPGWRTWGFRLIAVLGLYASGLIVLRYAVLSAETRQATVTAAAVTVVCILALVLASSLALRRAGALVWLRWAKQRSGRVTAGARAHLYIARFRRRARFAEEIVQFRRPVFQLAARIEAIESGCDFYGKLIEIEFSVMEITAEAECVADGDCDLRSLTGRLLDAIAGLRTGAASLDRMLGEACVLAGQVPARLPQDPGQARRTPRRQREEVMSGITGLAAGGVAAGHEAKTLDGGIEAAMTLNPADYLTAIEIDASGADLSGAKFPDLTVLENVIWTDQTTWPPSVADQVRSCSEKIGTGVYKVRNGREDPDRDRKPVGV
jgi:hypothetical protein